MSWQFAAVGFSILAGVLGIIFYLWRRDIVNDTIAHVENESTKKALEDQREILNEQDKIRDRFDKLRATAPESWDELHKRNKNKYYPPL